MPFFTFLLVYILLLVNYRQLNALLLGEELATTLGINLDRFRIFIILTINQIRH
nr:iron chelate uptake ABC transporter family permease subunit [Sporosarcina sp. P34]